MKYLSSWKLILIVILGTSIKEKFIFLVTEYDRFFGNVSPATTTSCLTLFYSGYELVLYEMGTEMSYKTYRNLLEQKKLHRFTEEAFCKIIGRFKYNNDLVGMYMVVIGNEGRKTILRYYLKRGFVRSNIQSEDINNELYWKERAPKNHRTPFFFPSITIISKSS